MTCQVSTNAYKRCCLSSHSRPNSYDACALSTFGLQSTLLVFCLPLEIPDGSAVKLATAVTDLLLCVMGPADTWLQNEGAVDKVQASLVCSLH